MDVLMQFMAEHGEWFGVAAALILAFERLARITPTKTDDAIVAAVRKLFVVLGVVVPDNPGKSPPTKKKMPAKKAVPVILLAAALGLSACGSVSISDELADRAIYEAQDRPERLIRAGGMVTALSEVVAHTVRYDEPQNTGNALVCLQKARAILASMKDGKNYWWFESDTQRIFRECAGVISDDFRSKIAALVTPGIDISALTSAIGQAAAARSVKLDILYIADELKGKPDEAWNVFIARLDENIKAIGG